MQSFYSPIKRVQEFQLVQIWTNTCWFAFPNGCEELSPCGSDLHLKNNNSTITDPLYLKRNDTLEDGRIKIATHSLIPFPLRGESYLHYLESELNLVTCLTKMNVGEITF